MSDHPRGGTRRGSSTASSRCSSRSASPLLESLGRVLAEDVVSDIDVAPFDNSAMDGYAVRAADVAGATAEAPVVLRVVEHIPPASCREREVGAGRGDAAS